MGAKQQASSVALAATRLASSLAVAAQALDEQRSVLRALAEALAVAAQSNQAKVVQFVKAHCEALASAQAAHSAATEHQLKSLADQQVKG
jgi:prephenate dehydratase